MAWRGTWERFSPISGKKRIFQAQHRKKLMDVLAKKAEYSSDLAVNLLMWSLTSSLNNVLNNEKLEKLIEFCSWTYIIENYILLSVSTRKLKVWSDNKAKRKRYRQIQWTSWRTAVPEGSTRQWRFWRRTERSNEDRYWVWRTCDSLTENTEKSGDR